MSTENSRTSQELMKFILENSRRAREMDFSFDDALLEKGIVDSLGILRLVSFIQTEYRVFVSEDELTPENFESIATISSYLDAKLGR